MHAARRDPGSSLLTIDPDFVELGREELGRAARQARVREAIAPGVLWAEGLPFVELAERFIAEPPVFVRHVCPAEWQWALAAGEDAEAVAGAVAAEVLPGLDPSQSFSVQARLLESLAYKAFDLNRALSSRIQAELPIVLDVRAPAQVVSLAVTRDRLFSGVSWTRHNLSAWAGGMQRFAREPGQISRAEFKLLEACSVFGIRLQAGGRALDLGAAPGGFTRVLRQHGFSVTAVDPGELHPSLLCDKAVRFVRATVEQYLQAERAQEPFDLILNDMRMDAPESARVMQNCAPRLRAGGAALITLKLPTERPAVLLARALDILREAYRVAGVRQLFHNRSEVTALLRSL